MSPQVKKIIERYIELIDANRWYDLLRAIHEDQESNLITREVLGVLDAIDANYQDALSDCLYDFLSEVCQEALLDPEHNDLHYQLDQLSINWYGYSIWDICDNLKQLQFNLGVSLLPAENRKNLYAAPNYLITQEG